MFLSSPISLPIYVPLMFSLSLSLSHSLYVRAFWILCLPHLDIKSRIATAIQWVVPVVGIVIEPLLGAICVKPLTSKGASISRCTVDVRDLDAGPPSNPLLTFVA